MQQYLLNQLVTSRNVYVKKKVLKLIEELLLRGHIEFKQNLRKQPEPLNEASSKYATVIHSATYSKTWEVVYNLSNYPRHACTARVL